jgi:hypothetical protein
MRSKSPLFVLPIVVVIVAAVVVWAAWLPADPELAAAEARSRGWWRRV